MKGRYGWPTLALLLGTSGHGFAQDAANSGPKDNNLPAITVEAPPAARPARHANRESGGESSRNRSAAQRPTPQHVTVNAPTPLPGPSQVPLEKAFDADKVPGTITTVDTSQIARTNSLNITDSLQLYIPGVSVSTVGGSDFAAKRGISAVTWLRLCPARRKGSRSTRTAFVSMKRSATP